MVLCCCTAGFSHNATRFSCAEFIPTRQSRCWALQHVHRLLLELQSEGGAKPRRASPQRKKGECDSYAFSHADLLFVRSCKRGKPITGATSRSLARKNVAVPELFMEQFKPSVYDDSSNGKALGFRKKVDSRVK